ncbi:MAG: exodeoxyribonuclease VII large subunit [Dinoroseobacter sp.]|jgi:exodeoxyribonuclease VII large subunit
MMDLLDDDDDEAPRGNAHEYSVGEISGAVKRTLEGEFGRVRVRGEVGRTMLARSGHLYFDLKDDRAVLASVSWKGSVARMKIRPEEGMEVVATGRITTFPGQSKYQLIVEEVAPAGVGALMAMLEKRKAALAAEGLFAPERKQPLPYLPGVIGVVTSPQGAVIRDILHRLRDRFPREVLVWPVAVQGDACAGQVANAIRGFNAIAPGGPIARPDLLIVARGGGSLEDLWGFNEESVVRAAAESAIPLISAVGHETDTTLIDYASDRRAPTPTAAAELAVPVRLELLASVEASGARLVRAAGQGVSQRRQRLRDLSRALPRVEELVERPAQRLDDLSGRLERALLGRTRHQRLRFDGVAARFGPVALTRLLERKTERLSSQSALLERGLRVPVTNKRRDLGKLALRLRPDLVVRVQLKLRRDFAVLAPRLSQAGARQVGDWRKRLDGLERMRQTLGYHETLARGYAVVRDGAGSVLTSKAKAEDATGLEIEFGDGKLSLGGGGTPARKAKPKPPSQGTLF